MSIIRQCRMNKGAKKTFSSFQKRYGLKSKIRTDKPCIFFGIYWNDLESLLCHKSLAIAIWRGSDILRKDSLKLCKNKNKIKHVAISSFIEKDLKDAGIPYRFIPITGSDPDMFTPCPLGDEIYAYIPRDRYRFYGGSIVDEIRTKCKFKINIVDDASKMPRSDLIDLYKKCFLGLRFTPHDGIANSVIEMGLMGRKCIYNDLKVPNTLSWDAKNIVDILNKIELESRNIGKVNDDVAESIRRYVDIGKDWLNTKYWR